MTVKTSTEKIKLYIIDNMQKENMDSQNPASAEEMDADVLAQLKAKMNAKSKEEKMATLVAKKERSLKLGVVGTGQAGSRMAETFSKLGYDGVCMNTALQDLKSIGLPETHKLFLDGTLGGAAKTLSIGEAATESHADEILALVNRQLGHTQVLLLTTSLGGGSGAGSVEPLVSILAQTGKPIICIAALPMENDDAQTKANALQTLGKLSKMVQNKTLSNLIVVDNAKIENVYSEVSQMEFFGVANKAICEPIDIFNTFSMRDSPVKALDSSEWAKLFVDGEGLSIYGSMEVDNFLEKTAIAEAILNNLDGNLLASGFNVKEAKYVGVMVIAHPDVWKQIPSVSVNYGMSMIAEKCNNPTTYKGIYEDETLSKDKVNIYTFISGLSLPEGRVNALKEEVKQLQAVSKEKEEKRNVNLSLDTGANETVSAAQRIKSEIAAKNSAFGKLMGGSVIDRRK